MPGMWKSALALVAVAGALAPAAASQPAGHTERARPFRYSFRIASLDVTATLTSGKATTTTRLRLGSPAKTKWLSWFGDKPLAPPRLLADSALHLQGTAAYASADPTCARTLEYQSSRSHPVKGDLWLGQAT